MIRYFFPRGLARVLTVVGALLLCLSAPAQADLELWATAVWPARYDGQTGTLLGHDLFPPGPGSFSDPYGFTLGPDGNVYVADGPHDSVARYDPEGRVFIDYFVPAGHGPVDGHTGIAFGPDGNLYVVGSLSGNVVRFDGQTGEFINVFASAELDGPYSVRFGPQGDLYVTSFNTDSVVRYDGETGELIDTLTAPGYLDGPSDLLFGPDGLLYVSSYGNGSVVRFDPDTGDSLGHFVQPGAGGLGWAFGLAFGPDGNLYVADEIRSAQGILRFDGETGAYLGVFTPFGWNPRFIAFVPEPGSLLLLSAGVLLLTRSRRF